MNWLQPQLAARSRLVSSYFQCAVRRMTTSNTSSTSSSVLRAAAKLPSHVLTTSRQFPSLEPVNFQPVGTSVLGVPLRRDLLWQAVVFELDGARVGSRHVKGRAEMGYSRKKLRPQKYTGRARQGDRGSPVRHDGGQAHAYKPGRDLSTELPLQSYHKAMRIALSHLYRQGRLVVIDGPADFVTGHANAGKLFLKQHGFEGKNVLFVVDQYRGNLSSAMKNCKRVDIVTKEGVKVRDVLKAQRLIVESNALKYLAYTFQPKETVDPIKPRNIADVHERIAQVQEKIMEEIKSRKTETETKN